MLVHDGISLVAEFALHSANGAKRGLVRGGIGERIGGCRHECRRQPAQKTGQQLHIRFHAIQPVRIFVQSLVGAARVSFREIQYVSTAFGQIRLPQNNRFQTLVWRLHNVLQLVGADLVPQLRVVVLRHARILHVPHARQNRVVVIEFSVNALHGAFAAVFHVGLEFRVHFCEQPLFDGIGRQVVVHARLVHREALFLHVAEEGGVVHGDPGGNVGVADPRFAFAHVIQVTIRAVGVVQLNDGVMPVLHRALPQQHGLGFHAGLAVVRHLELALDFLL